MTRIFCLLVLMLFSLQIGVSSAAEKNIPIDVDFSIDFREGLLRVSVENQKFQKVMDEVAQKAGIRIVINESTDEDLTTHFDYLPLEKGLKKLLRGRNYVLLYRSDEAYRSSRLVKILVFPKSKERTVAGTEKKAENKLAKQAEEFVKETQNLDQKTLEGLLQNVSENKMGLKMEFYEAFKEIQDTEGFREMMQQLEEVLQGLPEEGADLKKEIYDVLKGRP